MIDALVLYNYSLPGESLELNDLTYPVDNFTTEVDTRFDEQVKAATHGIWVRNTFFGKRLFHIEGNILAQDSVRYNDARRTMLRMLTPKSHLRPKQPMGYMEIWFTGFSYKLTCEFTIDSYPEIPLEALSPARSRFQINLKCFDPRLYGTEHNDVAYPPTIGGRTYPKTYPKTYQAEVEPELDIIVHNHGDVEVFPTITFYGPATSPSVTRKDSDGTFHTFTLDSLALGATDIVEADFAKKTARNLVTGADVYNYKSGEWWVLEPGQNVIRTNAASADETSRTVFRWRDGYLM